MLSLNILAEKLVTIHKSFANSLWHKQKYWNDLTFQSKERIKHNEKKIDMATVFVPHPRGNEGQKEVLALLRHSR